MSILHVNNLHKHFGQLKAVNGASFSVKKGTCFGLLGPNGAGKSTTIECIEKILEPTSGEILFNGKPLDRDYLKSIGVQFQQTALPPRLTVKECLDFLETSMRNLDQQMSSLNYAILRSS
jgi:ABC-2 type transport system ATP-binding protein